MVQVNENGLELDETCQLQGFTDDNLLGKNRNTMKKNTEALLDTRSEVG
jgi:hypothetical protein